MNKIIRMLLAMMMALCLAACGNSQTVSIKQTADAYLDQDESNAIEVTVDLSDGWSCEFARGAVYLYDSEITEGKESTAMLVMLEKAAYEDHLAKAKEDESCKETDNGIYFTGEEDTGAYLAVVGDLAYVMITTNNKADIETTLRDLHLL